MTVILYPFMVAAGLGFVLSFLAHLLALFGIDLPGGGIVWSLHVGIFVVWIPTVLVSMRTTRMANHKDFWKVALSGCPTWMKWTLYAVFAYAIVNFIVFTTATADAPQPAGDAPSSVVRGFSGHWMVFYGAAFATLYSSIHAPHLLRDRKCQKGHVVDHTAQFCPTCGEALSRESADV